MPSDTTEKTNFNQSTINSTRGDIEAELPLQSTRCGEFDPLRCLDDLLILLFCCLSLATGSTNVIHVAILLVVTDPVAHGSNVTGDLARDGCLIALHLVQQDDEPASLGREVSVNDVAVLEERWRS